jgi:DNA primase large subunit
MIHKSVFQREDISVTRPAEFGPDLSLWRFSIIDMRNETMLSTPELFSPENLASETPVGNHAREFVRWCCSLGDNFRNSPDGTNLQSWMKKGKIKVSRAEEAEILSEARKLFMKKVEQHVRRATAATADTSPSPE